MLGRILLFVICAASAFSADSIYIGTWKIESAVAAPWWTDRQPPDPAEMKALVGKTITITEKSVAGPRQFACRNPHYELKDYTADMLYQGSFGEMRERDKSVDPAKVAAAAGFRGSSWKTLETGCGKEIDYHFLDPNTASFGLNNYLYKLKKQ